MRPGCVRNQAAKAISAMTANSRLYALVLAGGRSRRMGRDKALLACGGISQLERTVTLLEAFADRTFVSVRKDQREEPERQRFDQIVDKYDDLGPVAGILSALETSPGADWLVVACDLPNVDSRTIAYLLQHRGAKYPFTAFRSSHDDLPEPLCAVYAAGSDSILRRFVDEGIICPRKIMMRSDTLLLRQPDPAALDNVNTPEELAESRLGTAS